MLRNEQEFQDEDGVLGTRVLALDIGGTKTAIALGTTAGHVLAENVVASRARDGFQSMFDRLALDVERALAQAVASGEAPQAIAVSIGGPVDGPRGVVHSPPNLPGWDDVPLADLLSERTGLPAYIEHDAKAGALAEWLFGAGRGCDNLVFLTLGTGLGAGIVVDGKLVHGRRDNAGEVGHWRMAATGPDCYGKPGCWEGFSSGAGLALAAHDADPKAWPLGTSAADVVHAARRGDPGAAALVARFAEELGRGIALIVDLLATEVVVLGSLAVRAGDLFLDRVREIVSAECSQRNLPCAIVPAGLGERIGTMAALAVAAYRLGEGR